MDDIVVWLIRHGESTANTGLTTSDPASIPLTEKGQQQAIQVASRFTTAPSLFVMSSYIRTQQTAKPTLNKFPNVPSIVWPVHEFTYLAPTRYNNTNTKQRSPAVKAYWEQADPYYIDGEGAESFSQMLERAQKNLKQLVDSKHPWTTIFTHGLFIKALMWCIQNTSRKRNLLDIKAFYEFHHNTDIPNASTTLLKVNKTGHWQIGPHHTLNS